MMQQPASKVIGIPQGTHSEGRDCRNFSNSLAITVAQWDRIAQEFGPLASLNRDIYLGLDGSLAAKR